MQTCQANWEDEENNRIVALAVNYTVDADEVKLRDVTPTNVTFLDPAKAPQRTIRVHTSTGASLLRKQWRQHGGVERLEHQLTQSLLAGAQ
jgi:hypothetical protein